MSKITNDGLTRSGTGCFIAVPIWQQWASKGYTLPHCSLLLTATELRSYESCEWISSSWLSTWMSESSDCEVPPVSNSQLCCPHDLYAPLLLLLH